ncbi:hypothetical protein AVEN_238319-1 [Araneus ventricosus]|uniref:Uncharacterized protein n=1 Tax=Araneus ventricosus TaxID=182803 RepID=A0A4Y2GLW1_ARAVE|nr:hypothetical protein AVEN_238319-1 [Araneus ventricosus]
MPQSICEQNLTKIYSVVWNSVPCKLFKNFLVYRHCNFQIAKYPTRANALEPSRLTHGGTKFLRLRLLLPPQGEVKRRKNFGNNGAGELIEAGVFLQDAAELTENDPDLNCVAIS